MTAVWWIATGLSRELTGIERFIVGLAREVTQQEIVEAADITVLVDADAAWADDLSAAGLRVSRSSRHRLARAPGSSSARIVHNFGAGRFPPGTRRHPRALSIFSIYDWGPFRDGEMTARARVAWAAAMILGSREADVVHLLNPTLADTRPRLVPAPRRTVVAYPASELAVRPPGWVLPPEGEPPYALFVGTAAARKRVGAIAAMASTTRTRVQLVGSGTEQYGDGAWAVGRGRVTDAELDDLMDGCSALVLVSEYEGFGIPVLEAAARGILSVVSAEVAATLPPDLQSWVEVVDPDDPAAFAAGVARAGTFRGRPGYSPSALLDPLLDTYASALRGGRR